YRVRRLVQRRAGARARGALRRRPRGPAVAPAGAAHPVRRLRRLAAAAAGRRAARSGAGALGGPAGPRPGRARPARRPGPGGAGGGGAGGGTGRAPGRAGGRRGLARREGTTLFMLLLAGFQLLLARLGGQLDVCVGTPAANRGRVETEPLIGFFVNTLVLRLD